MTTLAHISIRASSIFYAWVFSKDFNLLTTNNPALWGLDEFKDFKGQSTAGLPTSRWEGLDYDETLLKSVIRRVASALFDINALMAKPCTFSITQYGSRGGPSPRPS